MIAKRKLNRILYFRACSRLPWLKNPYHHSQFSMDTLFWSSRSLRTMRVRQKSASNTVPGHLYPVSFHTQVGETQLLPMTMLLPLETAVWRAGPLPISHPQHTTRAGLLFFRHPWNTPRSTPLPKEQPPAHTQGWSTYQAPLVHSHVWSSTHPPPSATTQGWSSNKGWSATHTQPSASTQGWAATHPQPSASTQGWPATHPPPSASTQGWPATHPPTTLSIHPGLACHPPATLSILPGLVNHLLLS